MSGRVYERALRADARKTRRVIALVVLGFGLCAVGAVVARAGPRWRVAGGAIVAVGLAMVIYELVFCDCS
jgi:hypothetical protein